MSSDTPGILEEGYAAARETFALRDVHMDHKLRPLVRVDVNMRSATIELHGCLTVPATTALMKILAKGRSLNPRMLLGLDLRHARHIEEDCLKTLHLPAETLTAKAPGTGYELDAVMEEVGPVKVILPSVWPMCPVEKAFAASRLRLAA